MGRGAVGGDCNVMISRWMTVGDLKIRNQDKCQSIIGHDFSNLVNAEREPRDRQR